MELPEKFRQYAGKTVILEYDPDKSDFETDRFCMTAVYRIKRVPMNEETNLAEVNMCLYGTPLAECSWRSGCYEFKTDSDGIHYTEITDSGNDPLIIPLNSSAKKLVVEADIMVNAASAENTVGMALCNDDDLIEGIGFIGENSGNKMLPCLAKEQVFLEEAVAPQDGYAGKWIHMIVVCNDDEANITYADMKSGTKYVDDYTVMLRSGDINKLIFGRISGSGTVTIGVKRVKAYIPVLTEPILYSEEEATVYVPSAKSFKFPIEHISDMEGIEYDCSSLFVNYKLIDGSNNEISCTGCSVNSNGLLYAENFVDKQQICYLGIYVNGILKRKILLNFE